jgi:CHAD domain-containing protein
MKGITEKWVERGAPGERVDEVAARTLQGRLDAVLHFLPLATEKAEEDREYVHQMRVWARRATAAVRLYDDLLPRRRSSWLRKQLKRVRRAANDARDCDVLLERLKKQTSRGAQRWLETVRAERARAQKAIIAIHERLGRDRRFERRIDKLVQRARDRGDEKAGEPAPSFVDWAREHLRPVVERFFDAVPADPGDEAALHRFRIRGKELRYALELLAGAFPEQVRTELYPTVEAMQDRLGEINDLATAKARLQLNIQFATGRSEAGSWRRLLANEQQQFDRARRAFQDWCSPQMLQDLQTGPEGLPDRRSAGGRVRHGVAGRALWPGTSGPGGSRRGEADVLPPGGETLASPSWEGA